MSAEAQAEAGTGRVWRAHASAALRCEASEGDASCAGTSTRQIAWSICQPVSVGRALPRRWSRSPARTGASKRVRTRIGMPPAGAPQRYNSPHGLRAMECTRKVDCTAWAELACETGPARIGGPWAVASMAAPASNKGLRSCGRSKTPAAQTVAPQAAAAAMPAPTCTRMQCMRQATTR